MCISSGKLMASASKVCITPSPDYFPIEHFNNHMTGKPSVFSGKIAQDIFVRVILLQRDDARYIWVTVDLPGVPEAEEVIAQIAQAAGVDTDHVIYTATHNHSGLYADNPIFEKWYGEPFSSKVRGYRQFLRQAILEALQQAIEGLQPAIVSVKRGSCYLNVNRNQVELGRRAGTYGFRPDGPTDRDLYLVRLDTPSGQPIAMMYNFAVHACMMIHNNPEGIGTELSGDFVGLACRLVEQSWQDEPVVMFTSGAAGDLNPLMMARVNIVTPQGEIQTKDLGAAGPVILEFMGNRLARDILQLAQDMPQGRDKPVLWSKKTSFMLSPYAVELEGPPHQVEFTVGLMMLGDLAIISTNGEIFNQIGQRLKESIPVAKTLMITHAGKRASYVKDDSGLGEYEVAALEALRHLYVDYCSDMKAQD